MLSRSALVASGVLALAPAVASSADMAASSATAGSAAIRIRLWFARGHRDRLVAPSVVRPLVRGRLSIGGRGTPGTVTVIQQPPGAPGQLVGSARAGRHGRFSLRLPPGGTRSLYAVVGTVASNVLQEYQSAKVNFAAWPRKLRAGRRVHFAGSVPEASGAELLVALQVRIPGGYETFDLLRTTTSGDFRGAFRLTTAHTRFVFRASIPAQNGFSLAPSRSSPVAVSVG